MDNNKEEESEKFIKSEISFTTPATTETTSIKTTNLSTTNDIDNASTDSSDFLASWTLINDKESKNFNDESDDHIDILQHCDEAAEEEDDADECLRILLDAETDEEINKAKEKNKSIFHSFNKRQYDDMHDIPDCTPDRSDREIFYDEFPYKKRVNTVTDPKLDCQPFMSEHGDVYKPFSRPVTVESQLSRRHKLTSKLHSRRNRLRLMFDDDDVNEPLTGTETSESQLFHTHGSWGDGQLYSIIQSFQKRDFAYTLYIGLALMCLWVISAGLLAYMATDFPSAVKNNHQLQQQVNEMVLQNNIMRAEIDLLNKQVKYLSTLNDPQQKSGKYKADKVFKAWSGNGDSLKPVDITKQDLKKPYKCPDGSFVEIANMCMEQRADSEPSIVDQFGQVVENLKDQSEAFATFEQVAEQLPDFQDNPSEEPPTLYASHKHHKTEDKNNNEYKKFSGKDNSNESKRSKFGRRGSAEVHDNDSDNTEWQEKRMKGREQLRNKNKSDEDDDDDYDDDDDSGEWHENYMRHREQQRKKNEYKSGSHEWHDNYMKNREQQRKQTEQKTQYKKNGHSRENKQRSGEKQYR